MLLDEERLADQCKAPAPALPGNYIDQNFDTYSVEYTFADGAKLYLQGRTMSGAQNEFASLPTARAAPRSSPRTPCPSAAASPRPRTRLNNADVTWRCMRDEPDPYSSSGTT